LQSDAIDSHLWTYWNNRFRISKLKTDSATWQWFWVIDHSSQPADNMSINYMHHDLFLTIEVDALLNWIDITSEVWERNESVVISNAFSWLYEFDSSMSTMFNIIDNKFQMYHHHLQKLKKDKITADYEICSTASFSKLFINHQPTTSFMLLFAQS
jgi:hypothetical protein